MKLLSLQNKKSLVHLHGGYYRQLVDNDIASWQRAANYKAIKKSHGVIVLSESLKSIFYGMIPNEKIYVVPNCVDDEFLISDTQFQEKVNTLSKQKIKHVLYLSNFIRSKGYREVLKMSQLEKQRCDTGAQKQLHFNFAGKFFEKTEEEYFFNYIKENKLEQYVTYHGIVEGEKKQKLLKQCNIFTLLTRYPNEGQPISILEAMGNGMLIVTTDHAGIPDIVEDGVNALVMKSDMKIKEIYNRIIQMKDAEFEVFVKQNRITCTSNYVQKKYINNIRSIMEKL